MFYLKYKVGTYTLNSSANKFSLKNTFKKIQVWRVGAEENESKRT